MHGIVNSEDPAPAGKHHAEASVWQPSTERRNVRELQSHTSCNGPLRRRPWRTRLSMNSNWVAACPALVVVAKPPGGGGSGRPLRRPTSQVGHMPWFMVVRCRLVFGNVRQKSGGVRRSGRYAMPYAGVRPVCLLAWSASIGGVRRQVTLTLFHMVAINQSASGSVQRFGNRHTVMPLMPARVAG